LRRDLLDDHLKMLRQKYRQKRDLTLQAIATHWLKEVRVSRPGGGCHLWCRLP